MARRQTKTNTNSRRGKKNFDPLSGMMLAQGTGIDRAVLGKRGFGEIGRALSGRRNPEDIDFLNDRAPYQSYGHIEFTPDGIERYVRDGYVYMAFSNTPVFGDGYRMGTPEESAELYAVKNPAKYERCVRAVQARGGANGYAVCNKLRRNPSSTSDAVYEEFHGAPPQNILEIHETEHVHGNLAGLGDLICIIVKLSGGTKAGELRELNAPDPARAPERDIVRVCCNEAKNQMYLVGGDQSIDVTKLGFRDSFDVVHDGESFEATELKDLMVLGEIHKLTYRTEKEFDDFEEIDYFHRIGEDTKVRPFLLYDTMNNWMKIAGGEYTIHARGLIN